jgi:hypothetical protein
MANIPTTKYSSIDRNIDKPIVFFGLSGTVDKTLRKINTSEIAFIADNDSNLHSEDKDGIPICDPEKITKEHFVIITTSSIHEVSNQLQNMGLVPEENFVISPELNDRVSLVELENLETEFYFTSGTSSSPRQHSKHGRSSLGGGLFKCVVNGLEYNYEQIHDNPSYGLIRKDENILFIDKNLPGILNYNEENGKISELKKLSDGSLPHGISYNESNQHYYVVLVNQDAVVELNESFEEVKKFTITDKSERYGGDNHHFNHCFAKNNSLYVTMFSASGNWKHEVYDGSIVEFNIETGDRLPSLHSNLSMPHNIDMFNGTLHVLDSLTGELLYEHLNIQASFPGFSRGLEYNNGIYYIGQSKNRNHSKIYHDSKTVAIDCGVALFDPENQIYRFLHFPDIGGIHEIKC